MDSKRKANGNSAAEAEDRSAKRRKTADFDLSKGESRDSTTAYGLAFLEQIRRTADKSGRLVATYFEHLIPKQGNDEYYKRTRMPISLDSMDNKLNKGEFRNLAELESYVKRMIANAKEFYPRSSSVFDDAERVRKALSNFMTKNNPAYGTRGYQAVPTPLPPEDGEEDDDAEDDEDEDGEGEEQVDDEEEEDDDDDDEDEDEEPSSRRRSIVLKRRGPGRPPRASTSRVETPRQSISGPPDHQYKNVPYKGLTFQHAQEKLVEELLRYNEPEYDGYFEPFVNLPPRSLRDYYRVITDPLSLKKLQKEIRGVQGRSDATGISLYKTWNAFAERAKLLWENAHFYNEEGSEIYDLAVELEKAFGEHLKKAQAAVPEPVQPKIKLKTAQSVESPAAGSHTNGTARQPALDAVRSASASAPSPSPSTHVRLQSEDTPRISPAIQGQTPAVPAGQLPPGAVRPPFAGAAALPPQQIVPPVRSYVEKKRLRSSGKGINDALLSRLRVQLYPGMQAGIPVLLDILPLPREMQQSGTVNLPANINRVFIMAQLPEFLQDRQYSLWILADKQPLKPFMQQIPNQLPNERAFDVILHPGLNIIEAHLIAAIPRHERQPGGPEVELEVFTAHVNVLRS